MLRSPVADHAGPNFTSRIDHTASKPKPRVRTQADVRRLKHSLQPLDTAEVGLFVPMTSPQVSTPPSTASSRNGSLKMPASPADRRHSSYNPNTVPSPPNSRLGSTSSQRKGSDTPVWLTTMNERNNSVSSENSRKGSVVGEIKGLFGRKKSKDSTPKPKQVITSKYAGAVRNKLKTDVRVDPSRRKSTGSSAVEEHSRSSAHMTAKEQEERHPHSGPVGIGAPLTTIVSMAEEDPEQKSINSALRSRENVAEQTVHEVPEKPDYTNGLQVSGRRKSVTDVEFKPGERARKKSIFGGWYRDDAGKWTR